MPNHRLKDAGLHLPSERLKFLKGGALVVGGLAVIVLAASPAPDSMLASSTPKPAQLAPASALPTPALLFTPRIGAISLADWQRQIPRRSAPVPHSFELPVLDHRSHEGHHEHSHGGRQHHGHEGHSHGDHHSHGGEHSHGGGHAGHSHHGGHGHGGHAHGGHSHGGGHGHGGGHHGH